MDLDNDLGNDPGYTQPAWLINRLSDTTVPGALSWIQD